jgi:hypothetical protein
MFKQQTERNTHCPHCGGENELHEGAPGTVPGPGDVGICWECGGLGVFTESDMRLPTREEMAEFKADGRIKRAQAAMREAFTAEQAAWLLWGSDVR